ncbi:MAG: glycosyltransferase [Candidatus Aenigmarchaeota archaeon]|nr:glycosyltransferase [Candidatus Aenigmarchaeota archaeon]
MISVVIPAYNEENVIGDTIRELRDALGRNTEIIVVADGTDNTTHKARKAGAIVIKRMGRLGKGSAVTNGMKMSHGAVVGFVDADGAVDAASITRLVTSLKGCDAAIASRRVRGSLIDEDVSFSRRVSRVAFNFIVNALFQLGLKDTQCGAKFFRAGAVKNVLPEMKSRGFEFDVELLWRMKRKGFRIKEIPVRWRHRKESKFSLSSGPAMLASLLKLRLS